METIHSNKLQELFRQKPEDLLSIYFTAGFPERDSTTAILKALNDAGADIVEVGIPYSDPLADGAVIQKSSSRALANGMNIKLLFEQLKECNCDIPIVLMGYLNPVLQFGMENFLKACADRGVSALILPDLPVGLYLERYQSLFRQYGIEFIGLITPQSSEERIRLIDQASSPFVYAVSSASTTGSNRDLGSAIPYLDRLTQLKLKNPILTGFNIRDQQSFQIACSHSSGAIVGSAFIRHLDAQGCSPQVIQQFIDQLKEVHQ